MFHPFHTSTNHLSFAHDRNHFSPRQKPLLHVRGRGNNFTIEKNRYTQHQYRKLSFLSAQNFLLSQRHPDNKVLLEIRNVYGGNFCVGAAVIGSGEKKILGREREEGILRSRVLGRFEKKILIAVICRLGEVRMTV